jgi:hypothetical protein
MNVSPTNFATTRNTIGRIANRRRNSKSAGGATNSSIPQNRRGTRRPKTQAERLLSANARRRKKRSSSTITNHQNDHIVAWSHSTANKPVVTMDAKRFNRYKSDFKKSIPLRETHTFGTEDTAIMHSTGFDEFGPYVEIYGEEPVNVLRVESTTSATPTDPGDLVYYVPTNPLYLVGTRAYIESKNYDRYKLMHSSLHYVPQVPVTQNGSLIFTPTPDDADSFVKDGERQSILRATGYRGAKMFNVCQSESVEMEHLNALDLEPLYTQGGSYGRDESEGFYVITAATTFDSSSAIPSPTLTLGWLLLKYHIRFYNPVLPVTTAPFIDEIRIINDLWGNVFSNLAINKDDPLCGQYPFWLPTDETQGYYAAMLLEDFTDSGGNVLQVYTETREQFDLNKGQLIFFYVADDKLADCVNFAISPSDAISKENPLRFAVAPTIVGVNVLCNLRAVFFPTVQEL